MIAEGNMLINSGTQESATSKEEKSENSSQEATSGREIDKQDKIADNHSPVVVSSNGSKSKQRALEFQGQIFTVDGKYLG